MTRRNAPLSPFARLRNVAAALAALAVGSSLVGCAQEDYYCTTSGTNQGCFSCDGVGCRPVTPPSRTTCRRDSECTSGQVCTSLGCVAGCTMDSQCARGWVCRTPSGATTGYCVAPTETTPTPMPGPSCRTGADCASTEVCLGGICVASTMPGCTSDSQCTGGQLCVASRCTAPANTCQFDSQCGTGRACVNNQCRLRCGSGTNVTCPTGQQCTMAGSVSYCGDAPSSGCNADADCGAGRRCLNNACYQSCTPGATNACDANLYCSDDRVCVPDTRPRPFCDATRPCAAGSSCVSGVCRVPCSTNTQCQMTDVNFRNCGRIPYLPSETQSYCLTDGEAAPICMRQADCTMGRACIDSVCR